MKTSFHRDRLKSGLASFDSHHVIHPYTVLSDSSLCYPEVVSASGAELTFSDGTTAIDGLSSWWACVHGYRRSELNEAVIKQMREHMSHVMFGGLTHRPACELIARLLDLVPRHQDDSIANNNLSQVFLCDSGSVAVEVGLKIALQYWVAKGFPERNRFLTTRSGYHGDTFLPMSVSDPQNGMHKLFTGVLLEQVFVDSLTATSEHEVLRQMDQALQSSNAIAGIILEPLFQGAGAMFFHSIAFLQKVRELCTQHGVLLILDEIATGFGRVGKMFACDPVVPDIMMVGKALTGGMLTMGATLITDHVAQGLKQTPLMHGPTFMGNPLACAAAVASIDLLLSEPWQERVFEVESILKRELTTVLAEKVVKDVRVLGAVGVIEFHESLPVDIKNALIEHMLKTHGVYLRPFGNFLYTMPPFNAPLRVDQIEQICKAMIAGVHLVSSLLDAHIKRVKVSSDPETFV